MKSVIVVGAGISGLSCALTLKNAGWQVSVFDASDGVGGRVRSDHVDGFILDRGFQVLSEAYPEARRLLDYNALDLCSFGSGALVFSEKKLTLFANPFSHPGKALTSAFSPVGTLRDKFKLLGMQRQLMKKSLEDIWSGPENTSLAYLQQRGFSDSFIRKFLAPFFRGIFLENNLETSSRMLEFTFSMFAKGRATLPSNGMQAIPAQLADKIGHDSIHLNSSVVEADARDITLQSGERMTADAVVWAVPDTVAEWHATTNLYFDAPSAPFEGPWLALNGSGQGRINQIVVPSNVSKAYAPENRALVSASINGTPVLTDEVLVNKVLEEIKTWFGDQVDAWRFLKTYRVTRSLPKPKSESLPFDTEIRDTRGVFRAGDDCAHASLQGAMESGRRAAEAVLGL